MENVNLMMLFFDISFKMLLPMLIVFLIDIILIQKFLGNLFKGRGAHLRVEYQPPDANNLFGYIVAFPLGETILFMMPLSALSYFFSRGQLSFFPSWLAIVILTAAIIILAAADGALHLTEKQAYKEYNRGGLLWVFSYPALCSILWGCLTVMYISLLPAYICHVAANGYAAIMHYKFEKRR